MLNKIALIGYGKMGQMIASIAAENNTEIVATIDYNQPFNIGNAYAAIEFTQPESAIENINKCFDAGLPIVVGTTGWLHKLDEVKKLANSKNGKLIYASNFSVGVNLFFKLNKYLAQLMQGQQGYAASSVEIHHTQKLDAPSGTAISLLQDIINNNNDYSGYAFEPTNTSEIKICSVREGQVPGTHSITYSSLVDDIEIKHTAHNRNGFAKGALLAAQLIHNLPVGVHNFSEIL